MTFKVGSKVSHEVYGVGTVLEAWRGKRDSENYAIKFKEGPMGWAENSTNDISDLTEVK